MRDREVKERKTKFKYENWEVGAGKKTKRSRRSYQIAWEMWLWEWVVILLLFKIIFKLKSSNGKPKTWLGGVLSEINLKSLTIFFLVYTQHACMGPLGVAVDVLSKWIADKSQVYTQLAYMRQFFLKQNRHFFI